MAYIKPTWWKGAVPKWQETGPYKTTPQDYFQQYLYNKLIPYLDPLTQLSTAQWLYRTNPLTWGAYASSTLPSMAKRTPMDSNQLPGYLRPKYWTDILAPLKYKNLVGEMPDKVKGLLFNPDVMKRSAAAAEAEAGLGWLIEALKTAQTAAPGATRKQQALAKAHLSTMYKEAGMEPNKGGRYRTLFENITNPVVTTAPLSGMFGTMRSTVPAPDRKGAYSAPNPFLT